MRFEFDEEQRLLQQAVRDFLAAECPPDVVRALWNTDTGRSPALWKRLADIGVPMILVPESHDGLGLDESTFVLLCEEFGRAGLAEPVVATAAVGAPLVAECGGDLASRWLGRIASGDARVAFGHPAERFVEDAHVADLLLLARDGELHAFGADDVSLVAEPASDPARRVFHVHWTGRAATLLHSGSRAAALLDAAFDRGALAVAAQLVGVCDRLLELSVAYTSQREQFGVPVGSFQAVKHALANIKVALEYARPLVYRAAWSVAQRSERRSVHVSMARVAAAEAAARGARAALQAHGAIGYTWEQDVHLWMRRAWSLGQSYGLPSFHRERMAAFALAPDAPLGAGRTFL